MKWRLLILMLAIPVLNLFAQETAIPENKEAAYEKTIHARAEKIVFTLCLTDSNKIHRVTDIVAGQYRSLNKIYTDRDFRIKELKAGTGDKDVIAAGVKNAEDEATAKVARQHTVYLEKLNKELTSDQVTKIKDGMTYNVLPITYKAFLDMIPSLKQNEKDQIMTWLVEAREYAMDAESSEKKHWWFGKYKGRINNYLSAAGYDLKKEREDWEKRIKEEEEKKKRTLN